MTIFSCGDQVHEAQERLVRLNLSIIASVDQFTDCENQEEMEDLNGQIRAELDQFRTALSKLRDLAKLQHNNVAQMMLWKDVENHQQQLTQCQESFRKANLKCILELERRNKEELFSEGTRRRKPLGINKDQESMARESVHVTNDLSRISRKLAETVERSALTVDDLAESSKTIDETNEEFKGMGAVIGQSRKLITKYGRRENTDKILILFAVAFFFACVFYVLRKRILGPIDPFALVWTLLSTLMSTVMRLFGVAAE